MKSQDDLEMAGVLARRLKGSLIIKYNNHHVDEISVEVAK